MKKRLLLSLSLLCIQTILFGQSSKKPYGVFENKTLFQIGMIEDSAGNSQSSILRFAPFANYTLQAHKDFTNSLGVYTGIGLKNVGFIYKPNDTLNSKVKSRAYSISIPLGLKYGNMEDDKYFYLAAELLVQFDYKEKAFSNGGDKSKRKNLYNNNPINAFNYSAMIGYNYKGFTIGAEYTLGDFYNSGYRYQPDKANKAYTLAVPSKSTILTFFIGFRTNLSAEKVAAPDKNLQQARLF